MQISNRIVHNYPALAKRTALVASHIRPFSISACQYGNKKEGDDQPPSVTHNYFESLKDYDEANSESYSNDRVEGSFWGGDPGQIRQPGDENEVGGSFMHERRPSRVHTYHNLYIDRKGRKSKCSRNI
jgi:hypothetical protein